jgi:hypothetical protein
MPRWAAIVIVCAGACASQPHRASPFAPSQRHAEAPRVATFAPSTMQRRPEVAAAHVPAVEIGAADGPQGFVAALRRRAPSLHRCFEQALRADPSIGSLKVPVRVHIGATGAVERANATGGPARFDACVDAVVKRVSVPRGAPVELEVPLVFRAG